MYICTYIVMTDTVHVIHLHCCLGDNKRYQSVTHNIQYIQGKLALLHKAKERAIGLLSSAIEAFKQADLRDGEEMAVDSPQCDSYDDHDGLSSVESTSDSDDEDRS